MLFLSLVVAIVGSTALIEAVGVPPDDTVIVKPGVDYLIEHIKKKSEYDVTLNTVESADLEDIAQETAHILLEITIVVAQGGESKEVKCSADLGYKDVQYSVKHYKCDDPKLNDPDNKN